MPLKTMKKSAKETLALEWILHTKNYRLTLDKDLCIGCQICGLACPKEAISLENNPKVLGEKARHAAIDIDLAKCIFCGICEVLCPFGAIKLTVNGDNILSVVEKESFPRLIRNIQVDPTMCPLGCIECKEACPLDLIRVVTLTANGEEVENIESLNENEKANLQVKVDINKGLCPCCRICEIECPEDAIHISKIFQGRIMVHQEKCPEGCTDCLDVCPITGALYLSENDRQVHPNELFCVYCGACKVVCPVDEALELKRTTVAHTIVKSGAWNKALERLASSLEVAKELKAKGSTKAVESVEKRFPWRKA